MRISDWSSDVCSSDLIESPGIPKTKAGIQDPPSVALLADALSIIPSTCPLPNFWGVLENFLLTAYATHAATSAPAPGSAPIREIGRASCRERVCKYV